MERLFKFLGVVLVGGLTVVWLSGCGQGGEHAAHSHDHDGDHGHEHTHGDGDGEHHHGSEDADGDGGAADVAVAAQKAAYPLTTCLVGGEKLGSMGDPVQYVHEGRLVQFCCEGCIDDFKKDATTYLAKLDEAAAAATATVVPEAGN